MSKKLLPLLYCVLFALTQSCTSPTAHTKTTFKARKANFAPIIDGKANDACWDAAVWYPLNQLWLGKPYTKEDFSGRFKLTWDKDKIYLLAEITDDTLVDTHPNPLKLYWDDDCLEVFMDEDASGGNHQYNHNAFAYHIALDYFVADINPDKVAMDYTSHIKTQTTQNGKITTWETAISVYNDTFDDKAISNKPVKLQKGKKIGFSLAYCDNDRSAERENFIGAVPVAGEDKNKGWIDAGTFGILELKE